MKFRDRSDPASMVFRGGQRLPWPRGRDLTMKLRSPYGVVLGTAALALTVGIATAVADVVVYSNDFSHHAKFKEIERSGGGKRCDRKYRQKSKVMLASVKSSPTTCSFRPPVQGDDELANYSAGIAGKILKKTPKSVRGGAFIEVTVRAGAGDTGYSLRIFPQKKRYELSRGPAGGGFPAKGKSGAINKINQRNDIRLIVSGAKVTALVNGKQVAQLDDGDPGQVEGKKIRFALGSQKRSKKEVVGTFKKVTVAVPDP